MSNKIPQFVKHEFRPMKKEFDDGRHTMNKGWF